MIPYADDNDNLIPDFEVVEQPSYTYKLNMNTNRVKGFTDEIEAIKQAIYKMLTTERYKYEIYSWNYGVELADLFGMPLSYVYPEIERRVTECLTADDRIESVTNFSFENEEGSVLTTFTANTIYGTIEIDNFRVEV